MDACNRPGAQKLTDDCNAGECQTESGRLSQSVCGCSQDILPGSAHFTAANDDTIDNNQGDVGPQGLAHLVHVGGQNAVDNSHKSCNGKCKNDDS